MKNKDGYFIGEGECPSWCNDGICGCDWIGNWKDCWNYKEWKEKEKLK